MSLPWPAWTTAEWEAHLTDEPTTAGGRGSGNYGHSGRPGEVGGSGTGNALKPIATKAFSGEPIALKSDLSKLETGAVGEAVVIQWLKDQGFKDARTLNIGRNNFPVDLVEDHEVFEVKTGLVSNGAASQQWRATIGQPGKAEAKWLAHASDTAKEKWNDQKSAAILDRKQAALRTVSRMVGHSVQGKTVGVILDPDRRVADVHVFNGFHLRIGWKSDEAKAGYVGSFKY